METCILSRQDVCIKDHINRCLNIVRDFLKDETDEKLKQVAEISVVLHDFGKFTTYYQKFVRKQKMDFDEKLKQHALISALYSYFCLSQTDLKDYAIFSYLAIKRHHTNPKEFIEELIFDDQIIRKQVDAIQEEKFEAFLEEINISEDWKKLLSFKENKNKFLEWLENWTDVYLNESDRVVNDIESSDNDVAKLKNFFLFQYIYSLLLDTNETEKETEEKAKVELQTSTSSYLTDIRNQAFQEVLENFEENLEKNIDKKIFSITLPTGLGKTNIGLAVANKLKEQSPSSTIIYAVPYTTQITVWNSDFIIISFDELLKIITMPSKINSRYFHKLKNAIVILDEVQGISYRYWLAVGTIIQHLADYFNTRFILMSAVKSTLACKQTELANREYFEKLDRYTAYLNYEPQTINEFAETITIDDDKTYLFILNTEEASKKMLNVLQKKYPDLKIGFFSGKEALEDILKCNVVISTPVIENFDVDFDVVYRDIGSFPAMILSSGKTNRNARREKGEFYVVVLVDDKKREYILHRYSTIERQETFRVLENKKETMTEKEMYSLIDKYFEYLSKTSSPDTSKKFLEMLSMLGYQEDISFCIYD